MTQVGLTTKSGNRKVGPIPVSTTTAATCPDTCPLKRNGCYADGGPVALHWRKITDGTRGMNWDQFCGAIAALPEGQLWRHNQAGDLPGDGEEINAVQLHRLVVANTGRRGFTYTHKPVIGDDWRTNRDAIADANRNGFTINLSANNLVHADQLADLGIAPVVTVLPEGRTTNTTTPRGRKIVVCPATYRDGVTCASCQLCQRQASLDEILDDKNERCIVGFPAHGSSRRKASAIARGETG